MFLVSGGDDPATVHITPSGPSLGSQLFDATGQPIVSQLLLSSGAIPALPQIDLSIGSPASGDYYVVAACYDTAAAGGLLRWWSSAATIAPSGSFTTGWLPAAPSLQGVAATDGVLVGTFTAADSYPPVTGFTVTATPASGTPISASISASARSFTLSGLTNGVDYSVSVTATNDKGSTTSAVQHASPVGAPFDAPTGFGVSLGANSAAFTWTAPMGETALRSGYELTGVDVVTGAAVSGSPFTVAPDATTTTVTGLTTGSAYAFVLRATYDAPWTGTPTRPVTLIAQSAADTSGVLAPVSTPTGLVLTQMCGRHGALPARVPSSSFPVALPAEPMSGVGSAPLVGGVSDPAVGNYPFPTTVDTAVGSSTNGETVPAASYPSTCGLDFAEARLIANDHVHVGVGEPGNLDGQYMAASARLSQITVVDVRSADAGWTVSARMSDLSTDSGGTRKSFTAAHVGLDPVVSAVNGPALPGYSMTVNPGVAVEPMAPGLGGFRAIASAPAGHGIGVAVLDARLTMLVPVWAVSGSYRGTLTLTMLSA